MSFTDVELSKPDLMTRDCRSQDSDTQSSAYETAADPEMFKAGGGLKGKKHTTRGENVI